MTGYPRNGAPGPVEALSPGLPEIKRDLVYEIARWHQTVSEVFSTAPRSPGTLGAQCHARVTTSRHRYNDAQVDQVLRTPSLRERASGPSRVNAPLGDL